MGESQSTCWTMVRGAAGGDSVAAEEFTRRYSPVIRAYLLARWRGSALLSELDDAVQEVFFDCFRDNGALARADPGRAGGFRAFLYGIVRNVALRAERKQARRRVHPGGSEFDPDRIAAEDDGLSTTFDRAWATSILRQAGARQAERAKEGGDGALRRVELLRLRFSEGLPIREIAARFETDPAILHREYPKAREEFKAALIAVVSEHQTGTPAEIEAECSRLLALFR